jgi:hypothetical protein
MTAVEWLIDMLVTENEVTLKGENYKLFNQAKEMESYNAIVEAKKYYLKGFEDAELTENQGCSHEQTMRDAESFFEILYPIKEQAK